MKPPFYTIGHSNRSLKEFVELLDKTGVRCVADVRKFPRSRTNPQFNLDTLANELSTSGIGYLHIDALGGRRGRQQNAAQSRNTLWENEYFRNYADYATTPAFREGFCNLRDLGHTQPTAIMCAEAVWWRCHRRIIADYLLAAGETVFHILGPGTPQPAKLTRGAHCEDGFLIYANSGG